MLRARLQILATLALGAALAGCDQPKPRGPGADSTVVELGRLMGETLFHTGSATPPPPAWAKALIGRSPRDVLTFRSVCQGNADQIIHRYSGNPQGVRILGWGWIPASQRRVTRVVLVDASYRIVGAGDGGVPRPDVASHVAGVSDPATGWTANLPRRHGPVDAFGLVSDGVACPLGHLAF